MTPTLRREEGILERGTWARSWPATVIEPKVGSDSLISSRTSVDLPEPEAPTTKTNSPGWTAKVTSSTPTSTLEKRLVTERRSTIAPSTGGGRTLRRGAGAARRGRLSVAAMAVREGTEGPLTDRQKPPQASR